MAGYERDPLSVPMDDGARALLARAYAARGGWVSTRLADPDDRARRWAYGMGINPGARDAPPVSGGRGLSAKTRWGRAFVRSLYYQHRWYGGARAGGGAGLRAGRRSVPNSRPLEVQVGRHVTAGVRAPAGRLVRVRVRPGGQAARRAVEQLPDTRRIYDDDGARAARWSDPALRDW